MVTESSRQQTRDKMVSTPEEFRSLDSLLVPPPVVVATPMSAQIDPTSPGSNPQSTPPTDFDG